MPRGFGNFAYGKQPRRLQKCADAEVQETYECATLDYEDHSFAGMMFCVACPEEAAVARVFLRSIWVRGDLGPMTVWWTPETWRGKETDQKQWVQVYGSRVESSFDDLVELELDEAIVFTPGQVVGLYVHSGLRSDTGLVYDNQRPNHAGRGPFLRVEAGRAHLAPRPFSPHHPWGAWRDRRHFVGKLSFGVIHLLWSPAEHPKFPDGFKRLVTFLCLARKRPDCPLACLPEDLFFFILHLLHPTDSFLPPPLGGRRGSAGGGGGPLYGILDAARRLLYGATPDDDEKNANKKTSSSSSSSLSSSSSSSSSSLAAASPSSTTLLTAIIARACAVFRAIPGFQQRQLQDHEPTNNATPPLSETT
mmetsp:Transcript_28836/g.92864  ORF Transcript_28836/g.92864 Transcript_28836/m.92864 type:complete len:363 (-) Transcript_28836:88-1176(-)